MPTAGARPTARPRWRRATPATAATVRDRPDGVAVRPARQRLPVEDRGRRAPGSGCRRTPSGRRRRVRLADVGRGRGGGHRRAHRLGRRSPARTTTSTWERSRAPTGRTRCSDSLGSDVDIEEVPASTWVRASTPPRWGVLESSPMPSGEPMRPWTEAMADYAPFLRQVASSPAAEAPAGRTS